MGRLVGLGWLTLLIAVVNIEAQKSSPINVQSKCLGNLLRLEVGPLGGNLLEASAVMNNSATVLTPSLASQCGFSLTNNHLGNAVIYASLQNCFAQTADDKAFTTTINLRLYGNRVTGDELYQVAETCHYGTWASREIVCDRNYMEVSVKRAAVPGDDSKFGDPRRASEDVRISRIVFFTPAERSMTVAEAQGRGYGVANTGTRLLLRSPMGSLETYAQQVSGVPMTVLKATTVLETKGLEMRLNAAAACPIVEGSVSFSPSAISWFLPRHIDPLVSSGQVRLLEVHVGIDGERVNPTEMAARGYTLTVNDVHITLEIPIGAPGGHFKSHVQDDQHLTSFTIEPMLELLWTEDVTGEDTKYRVLLPITTPTMPQPLRLIDNTVAEQRVFKVLLGPLGTDVALMNITFPSEVLSVADCKVRGFDVQEHASPNGSAKFFTLEVPFTDRVVQQMQKPPMTVYALQLTFGLLVLPEFTPFAHTAHLEATAADVPQMRSFKAGYGMSHAQRAPPYIYGGCDHENFYVLVKYGAPGFNFQTILGRRALTSGMARLYGFAENSTHFSLVLPFSAPDVAVEAVEASSIRTRLDVALRDPHTNANLNQFTLTCNFWATLTECFPNGTMTALAVKLESVPSLIPSQLTLRDPTCGPSSSDDRYAYFVFSGTTCGTTRRFFSNLMLYENEISLPDHLEATGKSDEPEYELKISCYYDVNKTHAVAFHTRPRRSEPYAENSRGALQVAMRLAIDDSFTEFHRVEDFPLAKYLQQPLYLEVEVKSANPRVSLELENCWATLDQDRDSRPRWNLIVNGCAKSVEPYQLIFHPVWADARVQIPSHFKRFEIKMFSFAEDQEKLNRRLFVHCDVVICDARNPLGGVCSGQCSNQENSIKGQRRAAPHVHSFEQVSTGPILIGLD